MYVLWPVQSFFWRLPWPLWLIGNKVRDLRFWLYSRYEWDWV